MKRVHLINKSPKDLHSLFGISIGYRISDTGTRKRTPCIDRTLFCPYLIEMGCRLEVRCELHVAPDRKLLDGDGLPSMSSSASYDLDQKERRLERI